MRAYIHPSGDEQQAKPEPCNPCRRCAGRLVRLLVDEPQLTTPILLSVHLLLLRDGDFGVLWMQSACQCVMPQRWYRLYMCVTQGLEALQSARGLHKEYNRLCIQAQACTLTLISWRQLAALLSETIHFHSNQAIKAVKQGWGKQSQSRCRTVAAAPYVLVQSLRCVMNAAALLLNGAACACAPMAMLCTTCASEL